MVAKEKKRRAVEEDGPFPAAESDLIRVVMRPGPIGGHDTGSRERPAIPQK
jgi:hypothetical protein